MSSKCVKSPLNSFVKKSNIQTVIFAKVFITMNEDVYKMFTNKFYYFLTEGKGETNMALHNYSQSCKLCYRRRDMGALLCFTIKECSRFI